MHVILAIIDCDQQEQAVLFAFARANAPAAEDGERVIKDLPAVGGIDGYYRELNLVLTIKIGERRFHSTLRRVVDDLRVVIYVARWRRQRRLIRLRRGRDYGRQRNRHRHTK